MAGEGLPCAGTVIGAWNLEFRLVLVCFQPPRLVTLSEG